MLSRILLLGLLLPASVHADAGQEAPDCVPDAALNEAAAELLLRGGLPEPEALTAAVRAAGSDLVATRGLFVRAAEPFPHAWLAAIAKSADAEVVCGYAQSAPGMLLLVALRAGSLSPLTAQSAVVRGSVSPVFRDPELVIADAEGELVRVAAPVEQLARGMPLSPLLVRPLRVQLLAHGPLGPRPVAERLLPSRNSAAREIRVESSAQSLSLHERLKMLRRERGRAALRDNQLLADAALGHAARVCQDGRVAHQLAGNDPTDRLRALGILAERVGETVARAETAAAGFSAFERSPSHLLTLLEANFTDVGIGEARDKAGRRCVVILLAAWPRYVGR